jgi:hypothetical protein
MRSTRRRILGLCATIVLGASAALADGAPSEPAAPETAPTEDQILLNLLCPFDPLASEGILSDAAVWSDSALLCQAAMFGDLSILMDAAVWSHQIDPPSSMPMNP